MDSRCLLCAQPPPSLKVETGPGDPRYKVGAEQAGGNGSIPQTAATKSHEVQALWSPLPWGRVLWGTGAVINARIHT